MFNLTNPHMLKGPAREVWPVGPQRVSVALPPGRQRRHGAADGGGNRGAGDASPRAGPR